MALRGNTSPTKSHTSCSFPVMFVSRCEAARKWPHGCSRSRWNVHQPSREPSSELLKPVAVLLQLEIHDERELHLEVKKTRTGHADAAHQRWWRLMMALCPSHRRSYKTCSLSSAVCHLTRWLAGSLTTPLGAALSDPTARTAPRAFSLCLLDKLLILRGRQSGNAVVRVLPLLHVP